MLSRHLVTKISPIMMRDDRFRANGVANREMSRTPGRPVETPMITSPTRRALLGGATLLLASPAFLRAQTRTLNLYSSRHYDTDEALYSDFTKQTGIAINRVEAGEDPLLARMQSEGANSPADVLITVDAGRIEKAVGMGLLQPLNSPVLASRIPANLRDPDGNWFGFSTRARVHAWCDKDKVPADGAHPGPTRISPTPKWKGKVLIRASSQRLQPVADRRDAGRATGRRRPRPGHAVWWPTWPVRRAAATPTRSRRPPRGEGDIAVANTYYFGSLAKSSKPEDTAVVAKLRVVFPNQGDRGTHVNISGGAGVAKHAPNKAVGAVKAFLEYLVVAVRPRSYFAEGNSEYPVVCRRGAARPSCQSLGTSSRKTSSTPASSRSNNAEALKIMDRAGWK